MENRRWSTRLRIYIRATDTSIVIARQPQAVPDTTPLKIGLAMYPRFDSGVHADFSTRSLPPTVPFPRSQRAFSNKTLSNPQGFDGVLYIRQF